MTTQALHEGSGSAAKGARVSAPIHADQGPSRFLLHYVRRRLGSHIAVLLAVLAAVGCAVGSQYGVKNLVDALGSGGPDSQSLWSVSCWRSSPATICCGGSPAGSRPEPLSWSAVTSASTYSSTSRAMARVTSAITSRELSPAASPQPQMRR